MRLPRRGYIFSCRLQLPEKSAIIFLNEKNEVRNLRKLLKYMRGYGKECILGPLFKLLEASFELLIPLVVAAIVDAGIGNGLCYIRRL